MINAIIARLQQVESSEVREGFYHYKATGKKFIYLQPYTDSFTGPNGNDKYKGDPQLQVVAGIDVSKTDTPTADLMNMVRDIREQFYKDQRSTEKPTWLQQAIQPCALISFKESEPCKYILPESHEKHGLAVLTLEISLTIPFGERL